MIDYLGGDFLYSILSTTSAITAIVSTSIYNAVLIPASDTNKRTINYYPITPYDPNLNYLQITWSVNCRHETYDGSRSLAELVTNAINRKFATVNTKLHFATITILSTLPPADDTDVYNTPVDVIIKRRA